VQRSGEVIPYIVEVIKERRDNVGYQDDNLDREKIRINWKKKVELAD